MRSEASLQALVATTVAAVTLVLTIFLAPGVGLAADAAAEASPAGPRSGGACSCPSAREKLWPRPKFADHRQDLDETDEIAALESVQFALTEVGDGSSYVWHRRNGRLSGVINPTGSFKDAAGKVCRHVVVLLSSGGETRRAEGVACRLFDGRWQLEG